MNSIVTNRKSLQPQTMDEAMRFAEVISKSAMVPKDFQGKPANTLVAIQWGMELGLAPMQALQNIAVINGKPSVYGDALLAMVRADSRCTGVNEYVEGEGDAMTAVCIIKRAHGGEVEEIKRTFSVTQAKQARLWGKQGPWQQYPERMLQHRARGNAIRDGFPDVIKGMVTVEEAQDMTPVNITPAQPAVQPPKLEELSKAPSALESVPDAVEVVPTQVGNDAAYSFAMDVPNKEPRLFEAAEEFADAYSDLLLKVRRADKLAPATRRTKMKELEQQNEEVFHTLPTEIVEELKDKRLQYNKVLSLEEKDIKNG